ncbi:hypothetical protein OEZ85_001781 [Tetradesmus obliquus]|uniref:SMP-LTD domain-containing protein n=1 Tax=Tetradesmus obliquus TaxID=3088 RepID=A0ABY8U0W1_TETOB|nr:hypothetical protein OEZ85_001781 [Tetradesmus obliquus]
MLQSSDFAGRLGGALQQWLNGIRRPAYLDRPQLVNLDLGSSMPIINSLKLSACPGTGAVATPQLQLDICYEAQQAHESAAASRSPGKKLLGMLHLRKASARALLYLPASMRRIPVQLVVEVTQLEGSMLMWLPPPPSDRLWISFMAPPKDSSSLTSSSSNSSCGWAGDTADSQQQQQQQQQQEEGNEEEWWMGEASAQLPKSEPKQSVMGASAPMTPRERSSSARVHSCPLVDADLRRSSACETAAASITEDGWHAASGSHSAAAAAATGPHSGAGRCRVMSETADSSADERAGSGISGGERGFASALLPGKFWKKRRSKSSRQLLQVGGADPVADMAVAVQSGILAL